MSDRGILVALSRRLIAAIGATAAAGVVVTTPLDESGRTVEATIARDGAIDVAHVRGPEYLRAYRDIVGVWTICDGSTKGVGPGTTATRGQCQIRLMRDLVDHAEPMARCVPGIRAPGRDYQAWAITSLAVNFGTTAICGSTPARLFRQGRWAEGCDAFLLWRKAGRPLKVSPGLVKRRQRERQICLTNVAPGFTPGNLEERLKPWR